MRMTFLVRSLVLALVLAASARYAVAQTGKITGVVTDVANGEPLEGVQILLQGTGRGAVTGANGRYFMLNVPPGEYTVVARRIGYQTSQRDAVQILIDVTREVNFAIGAAASQLQAVRVEADAQPLIQPGTTGSATAITSQEIEALPATSIAGVLALQLGFLAVPIENTDVTAFVDARRGVTSERIRGGRAAETLTLIDGLPINNYVLGGAAFDFTTDAAQQINYERGGFEAQYGNAMSGIINIATKEGGTTYRGSVSYSSSRVAGQLGSVPDDRRQRDLIQGFLSGPVPGTKERVRWMLAGRQNTGAQRVLEFDTLVADPINNRADPRGNTQQINDLFRGWRGVGFNAQRDLYGKLTAYVTPSVRVNLGRLEYQRQYQDYNPAFVLTGFNPVTACDRLYPNRHEYCVRTYAAGDPSRYEDILGGGLGLAQRLNYQYIAQGSTQLDRNLTWANVDHTLGRTTYKVAAGRLVVARNACDYLIGICLGGKIRNYTTSQSFVIPRVIPTSTRAQYVNPGTGAENFAGGDTNTTHMARADVQSQVTDHHALRGGAFYQQHDIRFYEARNVGRPFDASTIANYSYGGKPWDAALYVQDNVEYDFLTVKLGFRFDYTKARGRFFSNPLDPTNGTTVTEVCEGRAFGASPYTFVLTSGDTLSGIAACNIARDARGRSFLLDSARRIAFQDDFSEAPVRRQFSPRIGVQFPISTRSSFFVNYGVYTQNPIYNVMYQGTGIGRLADSATLNTVTRDSIARGQSLEGTPAGPNFRQDFGNVPVLGNPRLAIEKTTSYEVGFATEIGRLYALTVTGFAKDQSGLSGFRRGGSRADGTPVLDPAATYDPGGNPTVAYNVFVNTDFQTVRGAELTFRRRLQHYWAFDIKYGYQQVITNAAPPELELQKQIELDVPVRREVRSEIDQPHLFTGVARFDWGAQPPKTRYLGGALRNAKLTFTTRVASGLPYTPCATFLCNTADRGERNAGTGPTTFALDMLAEKRWRAGGLSFGAFVQVNNLLDRKNCLQPYPTTGRCDAGSLNAVRSFATSPFQNGGLDPNAIASTGATTTQFDFPNLYGERRSILGGLRASF
ncbi:MAG: TonB-dependent receptor [Gemmatimonadaceae bacterium]